MEQINKSSNQVSPQGLTKLPTAGTMQRMEKKGSRPVPPSAGGSGLIQCCGLYAPPSAGSSYISSNGPYLGIPRSLSEKELNNSAETDVMSKIRDSYALGMCSTGYDSGTCSEVLKKFGVDGSSGGSSNYKTCAIR